MAAAASPSRQARSPASRTAAAAATSQSRVRSPTVRMEAAATPSTSRHESRARLAAAPASPSREELVCTAQLSEITHRYSDMLQVMSSVINLGVGLTLLERSLFSRAYTGVIDEKCKTLDVITSFQLQEKSQGNLKTEKAAKEFRRRVEIEMEEACYLVINLIDKNLLRVSLNCAENLVFYNQMKGNCYKTLVMVKDLTLDLDMVNQPGTFAELKIRSERQQTFEESLKAYTVASEIAMANLCPTNFTRLALALNVSDFFYRLLGSREKAYQVVKQALDAAESEHTLGEESKGPGVQTNDFMGLLRDRLTLWNSEKENDDDKGDVTRHKNREEPFKSYQMPMDDCVMDQDEKPKETTDQPLELCEYDEERYRAARYMSGKNMSTVQKMFRWALDTYRT